MKKIKAKDFDSKFDKGENISKHLDKNSAKKLTLRRVNIDFPSWVIDALDKEASRLGISRQSLVKMWIAEKLDRHVA